MSCPTSVVSYKTKIHNQHKSNNKKTHKKLDCQNDWRLGTVVIGCKKKKTSWKTVSHVKIKFVRYGRQNAAHTKGGGGSGGNTCRRADNKNVEKIFVLVSVHSWGTSLPPQVGEGAVEVGLTFTMVRAAARPLTRLQEGTAVLITTRLPIIMSFLFPTACAKQIHLCTLRLL